MLAKVVDELRYLNTQSERKVDEQRRGETTKEKQRKQNVILQGQGLVQLAATKRWS